MARWPFAFVVMAAGLLLPGYAIDAPVGHLPQARAWDKASAANYLDSRQSWWMQWPKAQRDHQTACVSCHTAVPYALARPTLRGSLGEHQVSKPEQQMLSYITKRVNLGNEASPFYSDEEVGPKKTIESNGTEAVLNALILARYDQARSNETHGRMSAEATKAFAEMWAVQILSGSEKGSWNWLNFHNSPWEADESHYYGATLAAIAVGLTPATYKNSPDVAAKLQLLTSYLVENYDRQPLVNQIVVLWASGNVPALISEKRRDALLSSIAASQRPDGGWSLSNMGQWKRNDDTAIDQRSDGYATGLTVYALKEAGVAIPSASLQAGINWLLANQDVKQGLWPAYSLNKQRDPDSDVGRFMSDAATSYSVMALEAVNH